MSHVVIDHRHALALALAWLGGQLNSFISRLVLIMTPGFSTRKDGITFPDPADSRILLTLVGTWSEDDPSWEVSTLPKIHTVLPYPPPSPRGHTTIRF